MNHKTLKIFAIVIVSIIVGLVILQFTEFGSFLISDYNHKQEYKEMDDNYKVQKLKFKTLDRLNDYFARKDYDKSIALLDSLIYNDSSQVDLLMKRGYVYLRKGNRTAALNDFKSVEKSIVAYIGDLKVVNANKEVYYYAFIGEAIAKNKFDTLVYNEYQQKKNNHYVSLHLDRNKRCLNIDIDSVVTRQIYDY